ncbi:MAG: DUF2796 domain-containing protein [Bdellovibrionia bacterium]
MKTFITVALVMTLTNPVWAHKKSHSAHVHGNAEMDIAFDGVKGEVKFEGSGDAFLGFEHKPKNMKQEKAVSDLQDTLKNRINEVVVLPAASGCQWMQTKYEIEYHGNHSDVDTEYQVTCQVAPTGKVDLQFVKFFPKMKNIEVEVLTEKVQKKIMIKGSGNIEL